MSTKTSVEEGDLAVDTRSFKHALPALLNFTAQICTNPFPAPLPSSFTVVRCPFSLSHSGEAVRRRAGKQKYHTHREGDSGLKAASSCLLVAAFLMTVSSPEGMDERSTTRYNAAFPSPSAHVDAQDGLQPSH